MFKKGSTLYSIFRFKCPHCHEGDFYVDNNPYNLMKVGDIRDKCSVCHRKFMPEPGFYYGAMYVSYALGVTVMVTAYVATIVLFPSATTGVAVTVVLASLLVMGPLLYALSKTIYAGLFMPYKGVEPTEKELSSRAERAQRAAAVKS